MTHYLRRFLISFFLIFWATLIMATPKMGGELIYGIASGTVTVGVDPHVIQGDRTGWILSQVCEGLVNYDQSMNIVPWLAKSWQISDDGKQYLFILQEKVTFHNGREMKAADVKYSFERILDPATASRRRQNLEIIDSIEVLDDYTVRFNLKTSFSPFLTYLAGAYGAIIPKESVDADGKITHPVGTGPFIFVEWDKNVQLTVQKNPAYWIKGVPYLDKIIFKPLPDEAVRLTALRTGAVDIIHSVPEKLLPKLSKTKDRKFDLSIEPGVAWRMLIFNTRKPPFDNIKLRQAVNYALDREELMLANTWGFGAVKNQIWPEKSFWFMGNPPVNQDLAKVKQLLTEAGYPNGIDVSLEVKPGFLPVAEVVQNQLKKANIRAKLGVIDWASLKPKMLDYNYDMVVSGAGWYSDPDARYGRFYASDGPANYFSGGYANQQVDDLIAKGRVEVVPAKRKAIYQEIFNIIDEEVPHLMLFHLPMTHAQRKNVKGFSVTKQGDLAFSGGGLPYTWKE
ncbi:hypothetical protein KJ966_29125 [bacterium]|nr:hypothetical protein [bacterium]